jgi:hypothetical protein
MFWKKKKEMMTLDDIADALNECDRIVQEFQEKPIDPAYGHIMDIHLERIMKTEADSEDTHPKIKNLFFVTRDDGAFGKLDLLNEAALFWSEDHMREIGLLVIDTPNFWELKEGKITVKEIIDECEGYRLEEIKKPFVLSVWPGTGKGIKRRDIEKIISMVMEEITPYKDNLLFIESRGTYKKRHWMKPRGFKIIDLDKIPSIEN